MAMPTGRECVCCHTITEVNDKRLEKGVRCITESSGFNSNCLDLDVLETSYYELRKANRPPEEHQLIHQQVKLKSFCLCSALTSPDFFFVAVRTGT